MRPENLVGIRQNSIYLKQISKLKKERLNWDQLREKKILITGSTGLIGSCLIDAFVFLNEELDLKLTLFAAGRNEKKIKQVFPDYFENKKIHFLKYDAMEPIRSEVSFDVIIHGAGNNHPLAFSKEPVETMKAAFNGIVNIMEYAKNQIDKPDKVILLSSGEVYGDQMKEKENGCYETDPGIVDNLKIRACYPEGKRAAETVGLAYASEYELPFLIARLAYIYGPTLQKESSKADIQFFEKALRKENIILKSKGEQVRSYLYVVDAVKALLYCLLKGNDGETYNISQNEEVTTIRELAEQIAREADLKVEFQIPEDTEAKGYSKMAREILKADKLYDLGFSPSYSLQKGVAETLKILEQI